MKRLIKQSISDKIFWNRLLITIFFIFLAFLHWRFAIDIIVISLLIISLLPWLIKYIKRINIPNIVEVELNNLGEIENKKVEIINEQGDYLEVHWGESLNKTIEAKDDQNLLIFKARINFDHEAGNQYLLRVKVNGIPITADRLVNKPALKILNDSREWPWFNPNNNSWSLSYSPNFRENYFHFRYKVVNGDPYIFIFNLSGIPKKKDNKYEVIFEHNGMTGNEAYKNSIIVKDYDTI